MKRLAVYLLLFALFVMAAVCPEATAQDSLRATIFGQVFDEQTRKPVPGARVLIIPARQNAVADGHGIYRIDEVPFGSSKLYVSQAGYETQMVNFNITEQAEYRYNIDLVRTEEWEDPDVSQVEEVEPAEMRFENPPAAGPPDAGLFDVREADAFVHDAFEDKDTSRYAHATATYLDLLERLDEGLPEGEQRLISRHVAQVEFLLPDDVRAAVVAEGYLRGQGTIRLNEGAGAALARWWRSKDPLPATARNERLEKHLERVAYAEDTYRYRLGLRGFDDRGEVYVQLGPPTFHQRVATDPHVTQALLEINGPIPPTAEFWIYRHLDEDFYYVFARREGRHQITGLHDLVPSVFKRGLTGDVRGQRISRIAITYLHGLYRDMRPAHPDYEDLADQVELYRMGVGHDARIKPDAFARSMIERARFEDHEATEQRRQFVPLDFAPVLDDFERLPVQVRYARFLDPDGSTRTEVYTGHLPVPEGERTRTETRRGDHLKYLIESTLVRWDAGYRERSRRESQYEIPATGQAVQTLVLQGDTAAYGFTLQWDAHPGYLAVEPSPASRLRTGVFRTEALEPLSKDDATLEMSDLKPVFSGDEVAVVAYESGDGENLGRTPYPFLKFAPEVAPALYFEIYHLAFGEDDQTRYSIEYEVVRKRARLLGLLGDKEERTVVSSPYAGSSRTVQELIMIDLSPWKPGGEALSIIVRVIDNVTGRQVERHIDFSL